MARPALAQRARAIVHIDLRYSAEGESPHRLERQGGFQDDGREPRSDQIRELPIRRRNRERLIGRLDQPAGESDALGFVTVEKHVGSPVERRLQFPGEIDGVANSGVHALPAGRTVDVGGVAEQKCAARSEPLRDPMVDAIGREPVRLVDRHLQVLDRAIAHVLEPQFIATLGAFAAHRPDQARPALAREREDRQKIGLVEVDVQFAVDRRAGRHDIGDIEKLIVRPAWKPGAHRFANLRARSVAAGDVDGLAPLVAFVGMP